MKKTWILPALLAVLPPLAAAAQDQVIVLPAAASVTGASPFFSDVRAFNTSFTEPLQVIATYRCFIGACPAPSPVATLNFLPRESKALDDIANATFGQPNSGGSVEFAYIGTPSRLVVTSRLYATQPTPTVGMYVPGVPISRAHEGSVLTSVRNDGPNAGFRTNLGVVNPGDAPVVVTIELRNGSNPIGNLIHRNIPAHSGVQINEIFREAGVPDTATQNGVIVVTSIGGPVIAYAAVVDNATNDPYFVVGAENLGNP